MIFQPVHDSVTFRHGSAWIPGELVIPAGPTPHPAAALIGGSCEPRESAALAVDLADCGVMALSWDDPGAETSPERPPWRAPDQRVPELLAAVEHLASASDVPAGGIGVVGTELGAWSGIMAAALSSRIEALVLLSPPLTDVMEQEVQLLGRRLRMMGFIPAEVQLAQAVLQERIRCLRSGQSGRAVLVAEAACRKAPWYRCLPGTTPEELDAFAQLTRYDAHTLLSLVGCPVLVVFTEREGPNPVWRDAELARKILDTRDCRDHRVLVVPSAESGQVITWDLLTTGPRMVQQGPFDLTGLIAGWLADRISRYSWRRAG